ncbi:MAG: ELM1/GtrOC1 family putative glycosyltransferase [Pyramidobacter sp.]|uniref:mitochondrial fission ELM1 family protein n=1 Tax=unclassified Pyramidobacter TaxID=2632171 RepID=UPI000EA15215|nr:MULTISPECIES: ELM1/GtrOC1 family putative glycosyltransferase [unclassified Pyramidobacter]MDY4033338.1 ELM1/GtrOC1 family putative glycosyltransferase [Pyramidobacter sp.]RKJ80236.1 nucleoside-diphosphate sugar epimerase [Pyramidobacter sp. CG50-2]
MDLKPLLILLSENTRGHIVQSRGIRGRMQELADFETAEFDVPQLRGAARIKALKLLARRLPKAAPQGAERWLLRAGGKELLDRIAMLNPERRPLLFLSAGSTAAPYCLALAKRFNGKSCVVMTPSVLGTSPFDMAVVPKHDGRRGDNVLVTLGAPNSISPELLESQRRELLSDYPPHQKDAWGILIGGDDLNYSIAPLWVNKVLPTLLDAAADANVDLYITTSRRTQAATEMAIAKLCGDTSVVRMLLLASQDSRNPVPGILGHCSRVFCTEDSVSMISEAVTAGVQTAVVTVGHHHGVKRLLQEVTEWLVDARLLSTKRLWGVPRFNRMIEDFENQNYLCQITPRNLNDDLRHFLERPLDGMNGFNEAEKAARWILDRWLP